MLHGLALYLENSFLVTEAADATMAFMHPAFMQHNKYFVPVILHKLTFSISDYIPLVSNSCLQMKIPFISEVLKKHVTVVSRLSLIKGQA